MAIDETTDVISRLEKKREQDLRSPYQRQADLKGKNLGELESILAPNPNVVAPPNPMDHASNVIQNRAIGSPVAAVAGAPQEIAYRPAVDSASVDAKQTPAPGPISSLNNPAALGGVVGSAVQGAPGITKLQGGMFGANPMYTDDPVRATNQYSDVQTYPSANGPQGVNQASVQPVAGAINSMNKTADLHRQVNNLRAGYGAEGPDTSGPSIRSNAGISTIGQDLRNGAGGLISAGTAARRTAREQMAQQAQNAQYQGGIAALHDRIVQQNNQAQQAVAQGQLGVAQGELANKTKAAGLNDQLTQGKISEMNQLGALRNQLAAAAPGSKEHDALVQQMLAIQGKQANDGRFTVVPGAKTMDGQEAPVLFDNRSGKFIERPQSDQAAHADAKAAMAKGLSKDEVNKRLVAAGHQPIQ